MKITQERLEDARVKALTVTSPAVLRRLKDAGLVIVFAEDFTPSHPQTLRHTQPQPAPAHGATCWQIEGEIYFAEPPVHNKLELDCAEAQHLDSSLGVEIRDGEILRSWIEKE